MTEQGVPDAEDSTLSAKLERLFDVVRAESGERYTNDDAARACREATGESFSATYMWQLRNGRRTNPTKRHLEALAGFFGVPPAYFFDDVQSVKITRELQLLGAMRDASVRQVALRAVALSPGGLATINDMIEAIRRREAEAGPGPTSRGARG